MISGVSEARRKKFGRTPNRSSTRRANADFGSTGDAELAFVGMIDHASFQASKRLNYKAKPGLNFQNGPTRIISGIRSLLG